MNFIQEIFTRMNIILFPIGIMTFEADIVDIIARIQIFIQLFQ